MSSHHPAPTVPGHQATILLLSGAAFFGGAALRVCDSLLPRLAADFGRTPGQAGQVIISFSVAYGLMQLLFGPLGDRYGKARMIWLATVGCALGALVSALAPGFDALVALRCVWGMAAAGVIPLAMAWIGDAVPYEQRQATLAQLLTGTLGGMVAGQLTGGLFAETEAGWRGAFLTLAAGYCVVALLLGLRLRRMDAAPPSAGSGASFPVQLLSVLRTRWARVVLLAVLAEGMLVLGPMAYLPAYLHLRHGFSLAAASALVALYAVGGLVYSVSARRIVPALGERRMVALGGGIMGAGFAALWLSPLGWTAGPVTLAVGFGTYLLHNTLQTHATQMVPASRGTAVAVFAFCLFTGQAIGVSLAGLAWDHLGPAAMLLVPAVGLPLTGGWFGRALQRRKAN